MDDLISRQAAIDAIRMLQSYKLYEGGEMLLVDKAEVQTELMMLPSAQQEIKRSKDYLLKEQLDAYGCGWNDAVDALLECAETVESQQWIPVSEKPKCSGMYIVTMADGEVHLRRYSECHSWETIFGEIIAWMPLPAPWKGGES